MPVSNTERVNRYQVNIGLDLQTLEPSKVILCGHESPRSLQRVSFPFASRRGVASVIESNLPGWECIEDGVSVVDPSSCVEFLLAAKDIVRRARDRNALRRLQSSLDIAYISSPPTR